MLRTFGSLPPQMPKGFFKAVSFPVMAMLETNTGDHRMLSADGGRSRDLPLTIRTQKAASYGHEGAEPSGALFEVTFDPDTKTISGKGFLADDEMGRKTAFWIATKIMRGNSIDLAEIKAQWVEDLDTGDYWVYFTEYAIAATTIVATPAFADAYAELEVDDEVMASLLGDPMEPLVVTFENPPTVSFGTEQIEVTADGSIKAPFDWFYTPEAAAPTKIVVEESGKVYGHLGLWESCHAGFEATCIKIPRPDDAYASFNKPGPLTERGQVQTGPIFALGGHRSLLGKSTPEAEAAAYGGIENCWADVRVVEGVHGPWLSGYVRPGTKPETVYAARASRISGHWKGDKLKAIVSVNAEGFDVPGQPEMAASFEFAYGDDGVSELVASFPACAPRPSAVEIIVGLTPEQLATVVAAVKAEMTAAATEPTTDGSDGANEANAGDDAVLALLLEDDD